MQNDLISILLPSHNRSDVVSCAIQSVLNQSYENFELLVVGDGCTEETRTEILKFKDLRIKFFDLAKAPGFGYANRNVALEQANGCYIAYMSDDDIWFSDHLEKCIVEFQDNSIRFVYTKPLWVSPEGMLFTIPFNLNTPSVFHYFTNRIHNALAAASVMHRTTCFSNYGFWDESLRRNADWDMWLRIIDSDTQSFCAINEITSLHFHANWKSAEQIPEKYHSWKQFYDVIGSDFPSILWPEIENEPPQHNFWHYFANEKQSYEKAIRSAIRLVEDLRISNS